MGAGRSFISAKRLDVDAYTYHPPHLPHRDWLLEENPVLHLSAVTPKGARLTADIPACQPSLTADKDTMTHPTTYSPRMEGRATQLFSRSRMVHFHTPLRKVSIFYGSVALGSKGLSKPTAEW